MFLPGNEYPRKRDLSRLRQLSHAICFLSMSVGWEAAVQRLEQAGHVITVTVGEQFSKLDRSAYAINPQNRDDYNS